MEHRIWPSIAVDILIFIICALLGLLSWVTLKKKRALSQPLEVEKPLEKGLHNVCLIEDIFKSFEQHFALKP